MFIQRFRATIPGGIPGGVIVPGEVGIPQGIAAK